MAKSELLLDTKQFGLTSLQSASIITAVADPFNPHENFTTRLAGQYRLIVFHNGVGNKANKRVKSLCENTLRQFVEANYSETWEATN